MNTSPALHSPLFFLCATLLLACNASEPSAADTPPGSVRIADVQGSGDASPLVGQAVVVAGVVTGDFQEDDADPSRNLGGFFLQSAEPDDDPNTSDGIFVFDGERPRVDVEVGQTVLVSGTVQEHFGETQIVADDVRRGAPASVRAIRLSLPFAALAPNSEGELVPDLERYEGMLVEFPHTLTVTNLYNLERFGEVSLSAGGRLFQFTNDNAPGVDAYTEYWQANAKRTITLDDGRRRNNATPIQYLKNALGKPLRIGDTLAGITGNLRYSRGSGNSGDETWRLMPTERPDFAAENPRPGAPAVRGELRIASFNVLNYFPTTDDGRPRCGPGGADNCRGADSERELERQAAKTSSALAMMDADIVGLIELENNGDRALEMIAEHLNERLGGEVYDFSATGTVGRDAIRTGFIFKRETVRPVGPHALLTSRVDRRFADGRNRPALAQTFEHLASGERLTVVVNHLKSKGSPCDEEGDTNTGDGQGNCNRTRTLAAEAMVDWLAGDPTGSGDDDFLVIGDLNAYLREDPLEVFRSAGFVSLLDDVQPQAWSFVFDGQSGALDHALASPALAAKVAGAMEWHINADEAPVHDYNLEHGRDPGLFDGNSPYRASDHDPVIIGIVPGGDSN